MKKVVIAVFCLALFHSIFFSQISDENQTKSKIYSESLPYEPTELPDQDAKNRKKTKKKKDKKANIRGIQTSNSLTIPVTVIDDQGRVKTDLKKSDFQIFVDDKEIVDFTLEDKAKTLNLVLLLDKSPSTWKQFRELQDLLIKMVEDLDPEDKVMLAEFDERFKVRTKFTNDKQEVIKGINEIKSFGGTGLYDAVRRIFKEEILDLEGRTAIVLITDGVDTTSQKSDYEKSLEEAEKYDIPVFVIYLDTFVPLDDTKKSKNPVPKTMTKEEYEIGKYYLTDLVRLSGGRVSLFNDFSGSQKGELPKFARELRQKYYLKFSPIDAENSVERKQIKVRVNYPDLILFAKGSYISN
ncbi:MAG: VWA domain-containing protein [Pyrinomonadaceae bacterium]